MPALRELQLRFADALFDGADERIASEIIGGGLSAADRIDIYRTNLHEGFIKALGLGFPVIERLVGTEYFRQLALDFQRVHPSRAGDLHRIGAPFPQFLRERFAESEYAYLGDVAALEAAREEVLLAADATPISIDVLRAVDPADYEQLRFTVNPACQLVQSTYPIIHIWHANQPDANDIVDLNEGGDTVLVTRSAADIEFHRLPAGDFAALEALARGLPLGAALEAAQAADTDFDLGAALGRFMSLNLLVGLQGI